MIVKASPNEILSSLRSSLVNPGKAKPLMFSVFRIFLVSSLISSPILQIVDQSIHVQLLELVAGHVLVFHLQLGRGAAGL